jgi:hypothetical protein
MMKADATKGTVRPATSKKDVARAAKILSSPGIREIAKDQKDEPGSILLLEVDGEVVGGLVHRRETWDVGAAALKVARVWEVSGESGEHAFRETGRRDVFDRLVSDWCRHLEESGYHLAYAHGELALWPVHGFYPCFWHPRVYVPTAKALRLKPTYEVRNLLTRDAKHVRRLMERNRHLRPRVFATGVPNFHHYVVQGPGRRVMGSFSMSVSDGNGEPPVFIPEVEVENREAAETILAHAAPFAEERGMRALHFCLGLEHPFSAACLDLGGYFQVRGTTRNITLDEEMVRVVSVRRCLEAMKGEFAFRAERGPAPSEPKDFVLDVEGEKVPLRFDRRGLRVREESLGSPVVRLPRWAFTQLLMGYRVPADLKQGVVRPAAGVTLLEPLFPRTWPYSLCDHDLWDPALRDPDKYCEAALEEIRKLRYPF